MRKAILLSVESYDYYVNELKGCHNDTQEWGKVLNTFNFETKIKQDLSIKDVLIELRAFIKDLNSNNVDNAVIVFSGHGFSVGQEEGLLFSDKEIYDYHLLRELQPLNTTTKLTIILDSCYAAGVSYSPREYARTLNMSEELLKTIPNDEVFVPVNVYKKIYEHNSKNNSQSGEITPNPMIIYDAREHLFSLGYSENLISNLSKERNIIPFTGFEEIVNSHKINISRNDSKIIEAIDEVQKSSLGIVNNTNYFNPTVKSTTKLSSELFEVLKDRDNDKFEQIRDITLSKPNIVFLSAVNTRSEQAYERLFPDGNFYGIFSYYATNAISANLNLTYEELVKVVNEDIENNEKNINTKEQRISAIGVNDNRLKQKLFT